MFPSKTFASNKIGFVITDNVCNYNSTRNRDMSIGIGIVESLFIFGMAHYSAYSGKVLQILLIQGLGSIFNLYA